MDSKLPDVNSAIVTYRAMIIKGTQEKDWKKVKIGIYGLISQLQEDYLVFFDQEKYEEEQAVKIFYECQHCHVKINKTDIKIKKKWISDHTVRLMKRATHEKYWECPNCYKDNELIKSVIHEDVPPDPNFTTHLPPPPAMNVGNIQRDKSYLLWLSVILPCIEHKLAESRRDYLSEGMQEGEIMEDEEGDD